MIVLFFVVEMIVFKKNENDPSLYIQGEGLKGLHGSVKSTHVSIRNAGFILYEKREGEKKVKLELKGEKGKRKEEKRGGKGMEKGK